VPRVPEGRVYYEKSPANRAKKLIAKIAEFGMMNYVVDRGVLVVSAQRLNVTVGEVNPR
jgi:hypothetical protein